MKDDEARWIKKKNDVGQAEYSCSNCGELALGYPFWECNLKPSKFCPECGKKMINHATVEKDPFEE